MAISLRLSERDTALIKKYAALHNMSVSEFIRLAVLEKIDDEYDLNAFEIAMADYAEDGTTFALDEVEKKLGISN